MTDSGHLDCDLTQLAEIAVLTDGGNGLFTRTGGTRMDLHNVNDFQKI